MKIIIETEHERLPDEHYTVSLTEMAEILDFVHDNVLDTRRLTLRAPDPAAQDALIQIILEVHKEWSRTNSGYRGLERFLRERLGG